MHILCIWFAYSLRINILLPVNTLISQGPATVAPALLGWRWGWQLRARRPLACRPPGPPSALIGEPNPPGRQPPGTMQARPRRLLQQVPPGSEQPTTLSIQLPAAPVLLPPCAHLWWLRISRPSPLQTLVDWPSHALHGLAWRWKREGAKTRGPLDWENPCQSASQPWEFRRPWVCHENSKWKVFNICSYMKLYAKYANTWKIMKNHFSYMVTSQASSSSTSATVLTLSLGWIWASVGPITLLHM